MRNDSISDRKKSFESGCEIMKDKLSIEMPEVLYHFTSLNGLTAILQAGHIALSESNLNTRVGNCGVVWLTSSPDAKNHGLAISDALPVAYDKTKVRITLPCHDSFNRWDEWSDRKGMDKGYKDVLIAAAGAAETHKTWYISESTIPIQDITEITNMATGETISVQDALESLPEKAVAAGKSSIPIDEYIMNQPTDLQVLLLNVRLAIKQVLPDATEKISWQMPTFWQGCNLIHFAAQKNHLGIYPGEAAMKHFALRLTEYKTSKGAVQFPYQTFGTEQLNLITEIAAWCGKEYAK